jgi:hypothetical protein
MVSQLAHIARETLRLGALERVGCSSCQPRRSAIGVTLPRLPRRRRPAVLRLSAGSVVVALLAVAAGAGVPAAARASGTPAVVPVAGDWDGAGTTTAGFFDPATATWYLRDSNSAGAPDASFRFGTPGWIPLTGDWDGNGTTTVGAFDPATATWYLRDSNSAGAQTNALGRRRPRSQGELIGDTRSYLRSTQCRPQLVARYFEGQHVRYAKAA